MKLKLPLVKSQIVKKGSDLEDITQLREDYNKFSSELSKITEIRIYLKPTFHKTDISDSFLIDLEQEYANQFLSKMSFLPTKQNIAKLLKMKPLENGDFNLSSETIRSKPMKCLHIYPTNSNTNKSSHEKLQSVLSNEEFESAMSKPYASSRNKEVVAEIRKRALTKEDHLLHNTEIVEDLISKARRDILDRQLYSAVNDLNDKKSLSIENIRDKYLNPTKVMFGNSIDSTMNSKAKFQNIRKAHKLDILHNPKYQFPLLDIEGLSEELLNEITNPIDVPIEIIMKDVNFILDYFPIDELISLSNDQEEDNKGKELKKYNQQLYYKIKTIKKEEIYWLYKKIQSNQVYRVLGLTFNLIYWIVYGSYNRTQIDSSTKQFLYIKLLKQIDELSNGVKKKRLFIKIFIPFLIIVVRIACQNVFERKFKLLFEKEENKQKAFAIINEIITDLFDPNSYFNTFTLIGRNISVMRHQLSKDIFPSYKSKSFATSNIIDHLFMSCEKTTPDTARNRKSQLVNLRYLTAQNDIPANIQMNSELIDDKKKYITEAKVGFYKDLLVKVNSNLKKRNLEPIFEVSKEVNGKL